MVLSMSFTSCEGCKDDATKTEDAIEEASEELDEMGNNVKDATNDAIEEVEKAANEAGDAIKDAAEDVKEEVEDATDDA